MSSWLLYWPWGNNDKGADILDQPMILLNRDGVIGHAVKQATRRKTSNNYSIGQDTQKPLFVQVLFQNPGSSPGLGNAYKKQKEKREEQLAINQPETLTLLKEQNYVLICFIQLVP